MKTLSRKLLNFFALLALAGVAWFFNTSYHSDNINKIIYSFIAVAIGYFLFKIVLEEGVWKRIHELKTRYSFRKTTSILFIVLSIFILLRIWVIDPSTLLVTYGILTAGIAFALQDVVKNFAGGLIIFITRIYHIDHRIEVNNIRGDVIDIGLFYTTLLEIGEWVNGDQATGRILIIPNGYALSYPVRNYTKDHRFIWDEISMPLTYKSNWKKAVKNVQEIINKETAEITKIAESEITHLQEKYFISKRDIQPKVFVVMTDKSIMLRIRYITDVRERRLLNDKLTKIILNMIMATKDIRISI